MSRIAGSRSALLYRDMRRRYVPVATTLLACLFSTAPLIMTTPLIPDIGFLVLLTWRLLRPELWMPAAALGFGLFDDLVSGHPIGQSMALWTVVFLLVEVIETRLHYKDFWIDWVVAAAMIILQTGGAWYVAQLMHSPTDFLLLLPQIGLAVLLYPLVARVVLALDRWRLAR